MYLRIKHLRKTLKLSQTDFGAKIEVSRDVINNIEQNRNKNPISEYLVSRICKTFSVNEAWLRTGKGEMLQEQDESIVNVISQEHNLSQAATEVIKNFLSLSQDEQNKFVKLAQKIFEAKDE